MPKHLPIVPRKRRIAGTKEPLRYYVHMPVDLWEVGLTRDQHFRDKSAADAYAKRLAAMRQMPASALFKRHLPFLSWLDRMVTAHGEAGTRTAFKLLEEQTTHTARTVQECCDEYMAAMRLNGAKASSMYSMGANLRSFAEFCHGRTIGSITDADIKHWLDLGTKSLVTRGNRIRAVAALFNRLVKQEHLAKSPVKKIDAPKIRGREITTMPVADIEKLLRAGENAPLDSVERQTIGLIAPILFAGLRREESAALTPANLVNGMLTLSEAKSKVRARNQPQSEQLKAWLAVPGVRIGHYDPGLATRALAKTAKVVIPKNGLRHSCGSYFYESGMNIETLARMMCNSPSKLEHHYLGKVTKDDAAKFLALMPKSG